MILLKKYSKIIFIMVLLALLLVGCEWGGSNPTPEPAPPTSTSVPTTPTDSSDSSGPSDSTGGASALESTVARILARGKIVAGVKQDFAPFGYLDEKGEVVGFEIELLREFARRWLEDENALELVKVTSSDRIPLLAAGEVDLVAATMTYKKDREETIDFSQTYFVDGQSLLVQETSGINGVTDLSGKKVAAIQGSTSMDNIQAEADKLGITIEIEPFVEYTPALDALIAGQVDALTTDSGLLAYSAQQNAGLSVVGERFTQEPYAMGVPQGDFLFRDLVNFTLQDMKADGTYDAIYQKWFPDDQPLAIEIWPGETPYAQLEDFPAEVLATPSTIERFRERGRLIAGVKQDFAPFGYLDEKGEVTGFDVELIREFARRWLGDENAVKWIKVTSSDRIPLLAAGEVDLVAATMTHKRDREETIDFSQTYFLDGQSLLVQETSGIGGIADLSGKQVAAIQGSTSIDNIQAEADKLGITLEIEPFVEYTPALDALIAGQVDALTTDSGLLAYSAQQNPGLIVVGGRFTQEPYGIGVPQGDSSFRELVNFTLQAMKEDGTYDAIYQKWFPDDNPYALAVLPGEAEYLPVAYKPEGDGIVVVEPTPISDDSGGLASSPSISVIQRIKERDNLLIAGVKYDFKPFGFLDDSNKVVGFDVDLIQAMADEWQVEVDFVQVTSADRIPKLVAREVDMVAASMTHKKERDEEIDFSQTYFLDGQSLLVKKDSGIQGIQELNGKTVSAIAGSTSIDQIQAYADASKVSIEILPFQEYPPAIEALKAGTIDALTTDSVALLQFAQDNPDLEVVGGLFTEEPYGMGLPPGDSYFNNLVNFTLQKLKKEGTYDQLYKKWFGEEAMPYNVELMPGEWPYTFATSPTTLDKPVQSQLDTILADGHFVAGVKYDFAPFGFQNEQNELVGFDVDIIREFAKRWLGNENSVELVQVTSSDRIPKLAAGEVDIVAASMTHKQERDEEIDFSQTYFLDGQSLLVREDSDIKELKELDGKTITAIQGSTSIDNIQAEADKLGITIDVVPLLEYPQALEALKSGSVDALTTDSVALSQFAKENPGLEVVGGRFTSEPYGIGVPNYDDRFRDLVNFTLQQMKVDGTYDRLYEKWFGEDEPYKVEIWPGESYLDINTVPMLQIPAGEFIRGSNEGLPNEAPEQPILLKEFYIDQYEVTNFLYAKCVTEGVCNLPRIERAVSSTAEYFTGPAKRNYPVIWVTWEDANTYCQFVGKRLPTEAEWEKAARGTDGRTYPWGEEEANSENKLANFIGGGEGEIVPVGSHSAGVSPYGVHDMAGNVREWVADWSQRDYYQTAPTENPTGPESGVTKVVRGGAWNDIISELRTSKRKDFLPDTFDGGLGFRCASDSFPPER